LSISYDGVDDQEINKIERAILQKREQNKEERLWQEFALGSALRDMEEKDEEIYTIEDLKKI
jgi:hypothetical protein